jgi:hypothetical protein
MSDRTAHIVAGVGRIVLFVASVSDGRPRCCDTRHALPVRPGMGTGALRGAAEEVER